MESRNRWASLLFSIFSKLSFIILPQPLHLSPQMKHTNCFLAACACNQCCLYLCVRCLLQPTSLILILRLPVPPLSRFELLSGKNTPCRVLEHGHWAQGKWNHVNSDWVTCAEVRGEVDVLCSVKVEAVFWMDIWNTKGLFMQHTQRQLNLLYISQLMEQQTVWKQERFSRSKLSVQ